MYPVLPIVRIGVFVVFHPAQLEVSPAPGSMIVIESRGARITLEGKQRAAFNVDNGDQPVRVTGRNGSEADFLLRVPNKIERRFRGVLDVTSNGRELFAVLTMDWELAVASVVAAESPPGASLEALKAQAIVARSFYAASRPRHARFDFCDTTHCQFLREPPPMESPAMAAAVTTRSLVIHYSGRAVPALYSASCGGWTRSLEQAGFRSEDYPYYPVACQSCRRHARKWRGHGVGLCQEGAAAMALGGADFRTILNHYFPGTALLE